jgi:CheY-like chemotaxis protein
MDPNLTKDAKEQARAIEQAGKHLLSLVNDLIDLSRIEAGKLELSLGPVSVKSVLVDSLDLAAPIASQQGIEIDQEISGCGTATVHADYVRLRQVVINLLSNAIKYNRPQGTVRLSCRLNEDKVRIVVSDTGRGIPANKQSRIFNAFDRLGEERGRVEGTGIGLIITKRLIKSMDGSIGFESAEGQGSTFWVEFPTIGMAALPAAEATEPSSVPEIISQTAARPVVLHIEDNPMNRFLMQEIFKGKGLDLLDAHTAEIGIELAQAKPPALILMDINLPGMDGYEALKLLKADTRTAHIPVVAISANAMMGDEERGLAAGFGAYFTKPIDISSLYDTLGKLIVEPAD